MPSFSDLPPEIQRQIIHLTIDAWPSTVGICASVSSAWQSQVERRTFASLRLDQSRVQASHEIMTPARQTYVRQLRMDVLLPGYNASTLWEQPETAQEKQENDRVFTKAIVDLFRALKAWDQSVLGEEHGLSLELHAYSLNDKEDITGYGRRRLRKIRWSHSYLALTGGSHKDLPTMGMIKTFKAPCIPTKERRLMARTCCEIASRMPNLVTADWDLTDNEKGDPLLRIRMRQDFATSLAHLPESLRHLTLKYGYLNPQNHAFQPPTTHDNTSTSDPLSTSLRNLSQRLSTLELVGSVVFDSSLFWPSANSDVTEIGCESPHWPSLKELKIYAAIVTPSGTWLFDNEPGQRRGTPPPTSNPAYVNPHTGDVPVCQFRTTPVPELVDEYCLAAARAAAQMPQLTCLELRWEAPRSCMMAYDVRGGGTSASLYFCSSPTFEMSREVKDAWRAAALVHVGETMPLEIEIEDSDERF